MLGRNISRLKEYNQSANIDHHVVLFKEGFHVSEIRGLNMKLHLIKLKNSHFEYKAQHWESFPDFDTKYSLGMLTNN